MALPDSKTVEMLKDKFIQELKERQMKEILLARVPRSKWFDSNATWKHEYFQHPKNDDHVDAAMFNQLYMGNWDPAKEGTDFSTVTEVKFEDGKLDIEVIPLDKIYKE